MVTDVSTSMTWSLFLAGTLGMWFYGAGEGASKPVPNASKIPSALLNS